MTTRRNFLKNITAAGAGMVAVGAHPDILSDGSVQPAQFNMSGYAAPKLETVRIGFVGLGNRGSGAVRRIANIEGIEIKALCDKIPEKVAASQKVLADSGLAEARSYTGSENAWKDLCADPNLDLVYICTPWDFHTPMAVTAMLAGKHAATEVPAATTLDECWQLVETSEKTRRHCMMLENCCYDFFELLTLNMVRNGLFGDLVHVEGAYIHDLLDSNLSKTAYSDMWRLKENIGRNGNLYPTHGLGPIAQCLDINRGDRMDYLVSMQSLDFNMGPKARSLAADDDFWNGYVGRPYRGNMNNSLIKTVKGRTMLIQHDVSSPRPYSRLHIVSGSKAYAQKYPEPGRIALGHDWISEAEMKDLEEKYTTPLVRHVGEIAKKIGGHGGMDFIMDWRLMDCLRNGLPLDQDVYDAALWSSIAPLSEKSVAKRSASIKVPDFTRGNWQTNRPVDLTLEGGATTGVRAH